MLKDEEFQRIRQNLGEDWSVSPELCKGLELFVCALYRANKETQDVNDC